MSTSFRNMQANDAAKNIETNTGNDQVCITRDCHVFWWEFPIQITRTQTICSSS